jgi:hypothetical protein
MVTLQPPRALRRSRCTVIPCLGTVAAHPVAQASIWYATPHRHRLKSLRFDTGESARLVLLRESSCSVSALTDQRESDQLDRVCVTFICLPAQCPMDPN